MGIWVKTPSTDQQTVHIHISWAISSESALFAKVSGGWFGLAKISCILHHTRASNWYWLIVGQGLLSLQQVWLDRECLISSVSSLLFIFLFPLYLSFISSTISLLYLSFISSTISSISLLPFSGRQHKMTHKGWRVIKPQHNQCKGICFGHQDW